MTNVLPTNHGDTFKYEQHVIQYTACETEKTDDDLQASQNQKTVVTFDLQQILQYPKVKGAKQSFYKSRMVLYNLCFLVKNTKKVIVTVGPRWRV